MANVFQLSLSSAVTTLIILGVVMPPSWFNLGVKAFAALGSKPKVNKTTLDQFYRKQWLKALEIKVNRNKQGNDSSTDFRKNLGNITFPKNFDLSQLVIVPSWNATATGRDNSAEISSFITEQVKNSMTKQVAQHAMSSPIVVRSDAIKRNVVTFELSNEDRLNKEDIFITKINLWVYVWRREPKKKKNAMPTTEPPRTRGFSLRTLLAARGAAATRSRRRNRLRSRSKSRRNRKIKIKVFLVDSKAKPGDRGRRIAELKKIVDSSEWQRIGLPVSLFKSNLASNENKTLSLRVECRRCTRKTRLVLPGNGKSRRCRPKKNRRKKKKDRKQKRKPKAGKKGKRRRRKCSRKPNEALEEKKKPFIVIEDKPRSSRVKRSESDTSTSDNFGRPNRNSSELPPVNPQPLGHRRGTNSAEPSGCRLVTKYVSFSELNLDHTIVYPSEFPVTSCVGTCIEDGAMSSASTHASHRKPQHILHRLLRNARGTPSHRSYSSTLEDVPSSLVQTKSTLGPLLVSARKRNRFKKDKSCQPLSMTGLTVLHFAHDNNSLLESYMPNVVITECGCISQKVNTTISGY